MPVGIDLYSHIFFFSSLLITYSFFIHPHTCSEVKLVSFHWCDPYVLWLLTLAVHKQNVIDSFMTPADYNSRDFTVFFGFTSVLSVFHANNICCERFFTSCTSDTLVLPENVLKFHFKMHISSPASDLTKPFL